MKFSVLIPVYNAEKYLDECLSSISKQNYGDYEVIIIDDGSNDNSSAIYNFYKEKYAAIFKIYRKENEGLLLARRCAIDKAKGEYLLFIDADDCFETNAFSVIADAIDRTDADIILFNANTYRNGVKSVFYKDIFEDYKIYKSNEKKVIYKKMSENFSINAMWLKAVRSDIVDSENDYKEYSYVSNGEDLLQSIPLFDRATSILYINEPLYNYRVNIVSMSRSYSKDYYASFKCAFNVLIHYLKKWKMEQYLNQAYNLFLTRVFVDIIQSCGKKSPLSTKERITHLKSINNDVFFQEACLYGLENNTSKRIQLFMKSLENENYHTILYLSKIWEFWNGLRKWRAE